MDLVAQKHSLLSSWGQQGRDYLHALERFDQPENALSVMSKQTFFVDPAEQAGASRLQHIQSDILNLKAMPEQPESLPDDGSIQMVQAHSAQREVEILHDQLWAWFDENPTWKPSDVMVMCLIWPAFHLTFKRCLVVFQFSILGIFLFQWQTLRRVKCRWFKRLSFCSTCHKQESPCRNGLACLKYLPCEPSFKWTRPMS
jgi:hypothetical protein